MDGLHLFWNGYDHAPGRTAEEAQQWLFQESGCDSEGDGWQELPDDEYMRDEGGDITIPSQTCAQCAAAMLARSPLRPPRRPDPGQIETMGVGEVPGVRRP